jgi:hypothetical protein
MADEFGVSLVSDTHSLPAKSMTESMVEISGDATSHRLFYWKLSSCRSLLDYRANLVSSESARRIIAIYEYIFLLTASLV